MLWLVYSEFPLSELQTKHPICFFKTLAALVTTEITSVYCCKQNSGLLQKIWACCKTFGIASCVEKPPTPTQNMLSFSKHLGLCIWLDFSFKFPQSTASITQKISVHCSRNSTLQNEAHCLYLYTFFYEFLWIRLVKTFIFIFIWNFWIGPTSCVGLFIFTFLGAYLMCRKEQEVTYHVKGSTIHVSHACHLWDCSHTHGHF